jgi:DnaK suppressor protein
MKEEERIQLRTAIEQKKEELIATIAELKEQTRPMGLDNSVGRLSRMDYINNKSVSEAGLRAAEAKLVALDRWLSLYDTEKFGRCSRCNEEININRLLLIPESSKCIKCASR